MTWPQSLRLAIGIYEHNRPAVGVVSVDQLLTIRSISSQDRRSRRHGRRGRRIGLKSLKEQVPGTLISSASGYALCRRHASIISIPAVLIWRTASSKPSWMLG